MNLRKILIIFSSFILFAILFIWVVFNTSFGKNLIKIYLQKEINYYFPDIKIEKFIINYDNFSAVLKEGKNYYKLYGQIFPFDAILEGNIKEIEIGNRKFNINVKLNGNVIKKNNFYLIHSNVYFDKSTGFLDIKLKKYKIINFKTENIDINYFFNKFSIKKIKDLNATVNLILLNKVNNYIVTTNIKGTFKNNFFISHINFYFKTFNDIKLSGIIKSNILNGRFKANINNSQLIYSAIFNKFDLSLLNLIYPFRGIVNLKIKKDESGIIKFASNDFKGFKDANNIIIVFNMSVDKFFYYLNLKNIFDKGVVTGRLIISDKGYFNFIIQNAKIKKEIAKKLNLKDNNFEKIFINGFFDKKNVIFDLLTNNKNLTISIKKGLILLTNKNLIPSFVLTIINNKEIFYYKLYNQKLFLLKKKDLENKNNQILVF